MTDTTLSAVGIPAQHPAAVPGPAQTDPRSSRQWELDALRVVAICGVVAIHVFGLLVAQRDQRGTRDWVAAVVLDVGFTWVVPVFVMISGALVLAPRAHAEGPVAFYRKRFVRILPALLVWHVVYVVAVRGWMSGRSLDPGTLVAQLINGRSYTGLYFLWLIAGLYVLAPVLAAFLSAGGPRRAYVTAAVALGWTHLTYAAAALSGKLGQPLPMPLGALNQFWPYVGLFLAGWALRRTVLGPRGLAVAALVFVAAMAEVIWQFAHPGFLGPFTMFFPVTRLGPMCAVAALSIFLVGVSVGARLKPGRRVLVVLKRLSDASFGVFLVHLLFLEAARLAVPVVREATSVVVLLVAYAVVIVVSFAVSLVAARIPYVRVAF